MECRANNAVHMVDALATHGFAHVHVCVLAAVRVRHNELAVPADVCPPELKVRTPAHTKHSGWYLEFESRVTDGISTMPSLVPHSPASATC